MVHRSQAAYAASPALFRTTAACAVSAVNLTRTRLPSEDAPVHVEACLHDFFADAALYEFHPWQHVR